MLKSKNKKKRERLEEIVLQFGIVELLRNNLQRFIDSGKLLLDSNSLTSRTSATSRGTGELEEEEEEAEIKEEEDEETYLKGLLDFSRGREQQKQTMKQKESIKRPILNKNNAKTTP